MLLISTHAVAFHKYLETADSLQLVQIIFGSQVLWWHPSRTTYWLVKSGEYWSKCLSGATSSQEKGEGTRVGTSGELIFANISLSLSKTLPLNKPTTTSCPVFFSFTSYQTPVLVLMGEHAVCKGQDHMWLPCVRKILVLLALLKQ